MARRDAGFTLIEIVVVITMAALLFQVVTANLGSMIPSRTMDSAAAKLISTVSYLRSEARLQGKPYTIELDLDRNRYRILVPAEDSMVSLEATQEAFELSWQDLGKDVVFKGVQITGGANFRNGKYPLRLDENGFTADQSLFLQHEFDESLAWTIQLRGLTAQAETIRNIEGQFQPLRDVEEGEF